MDLENNLNFESIIKCVNRNYKPAWGPDIDNALKEWKEEKLVLRLMKVNLKVEKARDFLGGRSEQFGDNSWTYSSK